MVSLLEAVVLGAIQGITEWLPISSKSQSTLAAMRLFGVSPENAFAFALFLHIGTMLAAVVFFRKEIVELLTKRKNEWPFYVLALIGTGIVGLPLYFAFRNAGFSVFWMTLVIGLFLIGSGVLQKLSKPAKPCNEMRPRNGFVLGLCQGLSILPGVSRSGITTSALLLQSFSPEEALRVSFLLSIPTVFFAEILVGLTNPVVFEANALIAVLVAFVVGLGSLFGFMAFAKRVSFANFAIGFGILYLLLAFLG